MSVAGVQCISPNTRKIRETVYPENYRFDFQLFDRDKEIVGDLELVSIPSGQAKQLPSKLPYTFVLLRQMSTKMRYMCITIARTGEAMTNSTNVTLGSTIAAKEKVIVDFHVRIELRY